eukprot:421231-Alexandrium_andersonii.AAC.1
MLRLTKHLAPVDAGCTQVDLHVHTQRPAKKSRKARAVTVKSWPVLLPHELAHMMHELRGGTFQRFFNAELGYYASFWRRLNRLTKSDRHPALRMPELHDRMSSP